MSTISPIEKLILSPFIQRKNRPTKANTAPNTVKILVFLPINNLNIGTKTMYKPVKNPAFPALPVNSIPNC